jgi:D-alanine-D-alanine ligase-like ATP-grasp enzyme
MTPTSLLPQAAAVAGLSFTDLLDRLRTLALEKK